MVFEGILDWYRYPSVSRKTYPQILSDRCDLNLEPYRHVLGEHLQSLQYFL